MEKLVLNADQLVEKEWITCVIWHTKTFKEAVTYLKMDVSTLHDRRKEYQISDPPPDHYQGPVLTHDEMFQAFCVHMARLSPAAQQPSLTPSAEELARLIEVVDVKIKLPNSPGVIIHFSKEPPPPPGNAEQRQ